MPRIPLVLLASLVWTAAATAAPRYRIESVSGLPDPNAYGLALNDLGQLVSGSVLWDRGATTNLGLGTGTYAKDLNNRGQIVGYRNSRAFFWEAGVSTLMPNLGGQSGYAMAINEHGQAAGYTDNRESTSILNYRATLWPTPAAAVDLGAMPGDNDSRAYAINDRGETACISRPSTGSGFGQDLFLSSNGVVRAVIPDCGDDTVGGINNHGQIVGTHASRAFLWTDGALTLIGPASGSGSARAINDAGQIVGRGDSTGAFLYDNGVLHALVDLVENREDWVLAVAADINENGQIAGWATGACSSSPRSRKRWTWSSRAPPPPMARPLRWATAPMPSSRAPA